MEDWARARGLHRLELRVDEENERGLRLYRRRGFAEEGRLVACYRGSDGMRNHRWMGKLLADALPALSYVEPALPAPRRGSNGVVVRPVEPSDAAAVQMFDRHQLGALKGIYLKSIDEVLADVAAVEAQLAGMRQPGLFASRDSAHDRQALRPFEAEPRHGVGDRGCRRRHARLATPVGGSVERTIVTSTSGISWMRRDR